MSIVAPLSGGFEGLTVGAMVSAPFGLKTEYDAEVRLESSQYTGARWITAQTPEALREFENAYPLRMAHDAANALAYMCTSPYDVRLAQERFPKIEFHPLREHAGLALSAG